MKSIENSNLVIKKGSNYGLIDSTGKELIPANYQELGYTFGNNYIAKKENKYVENTSD